MILVFGFCIMIVHPQVQEREISAFLACSEPVEQKASYVGTSELYFSSFRQNYHVSF